jgi:hypothetical protein
LQHRQKDQAALSMSLLEEESWQYQAFLSLVSQMTKDDWRDFYWIRSLIRLSGDWICCLSEPLLQRWSFLPTLFGAVLLKIIVTARLATSGWVCFQNYSIKTAGFK